MGIFVKDNISDINVGSKSTDVSGKTVQSSNIDISSIERGNSEFSSNSNISSSVDFGDLFNDKANASDVSSTSMTNGSTNINGMNQTSSSVQQQGMNNDKVNQNSTNQQTGNVQSASLSDRKNEENNTSQSTGTASAQGTTSSGNQESSTGQTGGSVNGASTSSGRGTSGSTGGTSGEASTNSMSSGNTGSGRGGHNTGGAEVKSTSVQGATRPTALNNNSSMQQTGTTVSQKTANSSHVDTNTSNAQNNTGSKIAKGVRWFIKEVVNVIDVVESTKTVITTSVLSAVGNIFEAIVIDGYLGYIIAGKLDFIGADNLANELRKFAARDLVGEANKWFYEETDRGKHINEKSLIKYDSAIAKGVTTFTELTVVIAAAAVVEVFTGGTATPAILAVFGGLGFLKGAGDQAEGAYQEKLEAGIEDLSLGAIDNLKVIGRGGLEALSWVFKAKAGVGIGQMIEAAKVSSWGEVLTLVKNDFLSEKNLKMMFSKGNVIMNAIGAGFQSSPQIMKVVQKARVGELESKDVAFLVVELIGYFGLNTVTDGLRNVTSGFISPKKAKMLADNLIKGKKGASLAKFLQEYNDSSVERIISNLNGSDVYTHIQKLDSEDITKILNMLNDSQKGDFAVKASFEFLKTDGSKLLSLDDLGKYGDEMQEQIFNQIVYRVVNKEDVLSLDDVKKVCDEDLFKKIDLKVYDTKVSNLYDEGMEAARTNYNAFFKNFREHAGLHTKLVRDYAVDLAKKAGFSEDEISTIKYSAECHDLGMKGGVFKPTAKDLKKLGLSEEQAATFLEQYNKSGRQYLTLDPEELQNTLKKVLGEDINIDLNEFNLSMIVRKNHPLNSAIIILEENTVPEGTNVQVAALLAMTHSKSTSGISSFDDPEMWHDCINKLEEVMNDCGKGDLFDADSLRKLVDNEEEFMKLKDAALCIRDGDAMSKLALTYVLSKEGDTIMQTGEFVHTDVEKTRLELDETPETRYNMDEARIKQIRQDIIDEYAKKGEKLKEEDLESLVNEKAKDLLAEDEASDIIDNVYNADGTRKLDSDGNPVDINNGMSRRIHAGEKNVEFSSDYTPNGNERLYDGTARIKDPTVCPISTMEAVEERAGEVVTYTNCTERKLEIELNIPEDSNLGKWYQKRLEDFKKAQVSKLDQAREDRLTKRINSIVTDDKFKIPEGKDLSSAIFDYIEKHPDQKGQILKEYKSYVDYVDSITDFYKNKLKIKWV